GAYGLSGVLMAMNVLLWKGAVHGKRRNLFIAAAIVTAVCVYGYVRMNTILLERAGRVALVQGSVPQEMKEQLEEDTYDPVAAFGKYLQASQTIPQTEKIDLLVWPETVVLSPFTLNVDPAILNDSLEKEARFAQGSLGRLALTHDAWFLVGSTSFLPAQYGYVS